MRQLVSLIMYMNNIFFFIIVVPLFNDIVTGLNNIRHHSIHSYNPYSFQQTDSDNNESNKSKNENNKNDKSESEKPNDDVDNNNNKESQNKSNSDSVNSTVDKSNNESNEQNNTDSNSNVDKSQNNENDESDDSDSDDKNNTSDVLLDNVILNPSAANVDLTIKTLRNEIGNSINSFKHVCTLVEELISIMPQETKTAEIELYTKKIITSELYNECVKHLTTLESFENDLDKFSTQAQISLVYTHHT